MSSKANINVSSVFPKYLFWEYDVNSLKFDEDEAIIIPRSLYFSTKNSFNNDIEKLEKFYSKKTITNNLKNTKELISDQVCVLVAQRYNLPTFTRFGK